MSYLAMLWAEKPDAPVIAAALLLVLLGFVGGFIVGWIAHRDEDRRYRQSRERYYQRQLAEAFEDRDRALAEAVRVPAAPTPAVVHVHVPALYPGWSQPQTIDAQIVPALPAQSDGVA